MSEEPTDLPSDALLDSSISDDSEANCPFATEPPLSIAHLMLCGLCVAVYLSAARTAMQSYELPFSLTGMQITLWTLQGLIQGTGLAGILLLAIHRLRRISFPQHGGEMLWIVIGTPAAINLASHLAFILTHNSWFIRYLSYIFDDNRWSRLLTPACGLLFLAAWSAVYLYAILYAGTRRWSVVFMIMVATGIAAHVLNGLLAHSAGLSQTVTIGVVTQFSHQLIVVTSLLVASTIDLRQSVRYPWTHWTGVILYLLQFAGTAVGLLAIRIIVP